MVRPVINSEQLSARRRATLLLLLLIATSFLMGMAIVTRAARTSYEKNEWQAIERMMSTMQMPTLQLTPEDVVRRQMSALHAYQQDPAQMWQCYVLASPANRAVTGPFARFEEMVCSPPYASMVTSKNFIVGRSTIRGDYATVLVTVVTVDRRPTVFRFYLSKQRQGKHVNCWMTEQVVCERQGPGTDAEKFASAGRTKPQV